MNFALCHPSRGRPDQAYTTFLKWMGNATDTDQYEYILSLDSDDPFLEQYRKRFAKSGVEIIVNNNRSMVDASNRAAETASDTIGAYILVSDDFDCPKGWNESVAARMRPEPTLLHIDDEINTDGTLQTDVVTLTIMNRALYDKLGYLYHPGYFHLFVDNDLTETARMLGAYVPAFDLKFPHQHWMNGRAKQDNTYQRGNSREAYMSGQALFERRKADGFPLLKTIPA